VTTSELLNQKIVKHKKDVLMALQDKQMEGVMGMLAKAADGCRNPKQASQIIQNAKEMLQEDTPKYFAEWADEGLNGEVRMLMPFSDGVYDFDCMLPAGDPRIRRKPKITDYIVKRLAYPIPKKSNPKHRKLIMDFLTSVCGVPSPLLRGFAAWNDHAPDHSFHLGWRA